MVYGYGMDEAQASLWTLLFSTGDSVMLEMLHFEI